MWVIGYSLYLVGMNMDLSRVVETAAGQSAIRDRALRSITHLAKLLVPAVILIVAAAASRLSAREGRAEGFRIDARRSGVAAVVMEQRALRRPVGGCRLAPMDARLAARPPPGPGWPID